MNRTIKLGLAAGITALSTGCMIPYQQDSTPNTSSIDPSRYYLPNICDGITQGIYDVRNVVYNTALDLNTRPTDQDLAVAKTHIADVCAIQIRECQAHIDDTHMRVANQTLPDTALSESRYQNCRAFTEGIETE